MVMNVFTLAVHASTTCSSALLSACRSFLREGIVRNGCRRWSEAASTALCASRSASETGVTAAVAAADSHRMVASCQRMRVASKSLRQPETPSSARARRASVDSHRNERYVEAKFKITTRRNKYSVALYTRGIEKVRKIVHIWNIHKCRTGKIESRMMAGAGTLSPPTFYKYG